MAPSERWRSVCDSLKKKWAGARKSYMKTHDEIWGDFCSESLMAGPVALRLPRNCTLSYNYLLQFGGIDIRNLCIVDLYSCKNAADLRSSSITRQTSERFVSGS